MNKNVFMYFGLLILIAILFSACESFDEGGRVSKADKNLEGTWKLDKYLRNGTDETSTLYISNYQETYSSNGEYPRSYNEREGDPFNESGTWELSDDNKVIRISDVSSIQDFSPEHSTLSSSTYIIIKLTDDELWYHYENGGDDHEFWLVR